MSLSCPQLALGHGARRLHVAAAYRAKAQVSMSRFEPTSFVSYDTLQSNVDVVRKRLAPTCILLCQRHVCLPLGTVFPQQHFFSPVEPNEQAVAHSSPDF